MPFEEPAARAPVPEAMILLATDAGDVVRDCFVAGCTAAETPDRSPVAATGDAALFIPGFVATGLYEPAPLRPFAEKAA